MSGDKICESSVIKKLVPGQYELFIAVVLAYHW